MAESLSNPEKQKGKQPYNTLENISVFIQGLVINIKQAFLWLNVLV